MDKDDVVLDLKLILDISQALFPFFILIASKIYHIFR